MTVNDTTNGEDLLIEVYDPAWTSNGSTSCGSKNDRRDMPSDSELDDRDPGHFPKGQNFFMIRTGFDAATGLETYGGDVTLAAQGRMPVNANLPLAQQTFFLAQVFPTNRERTLVVEMFDVGDASVEGTIAIQPPAESSLSSFSGCSFEWSQASSLVYDASQCELQQVKASNGFNGRTVLAYIPIPDEDTYDCNASASDGCWITLYADFAGPLTDFTTWSAYITGDPVRLIK